MVDLDAKVIEVSRKYLPSYSNCTGFGTPSCFDDPRADVYAEDFFTWFDNHMGSDICEVREEKRDILYDVIILDLLDPESLPADAPFAKYLYSDEFFKKVSCALNDQGVLVSNFGEAPESPIGGGPKKQNEHPMFLARMAMFQDKLERIRNLSKNFYFTRVYDASVPSYRANWAFVLGMVPRGVNQSLSDEQIRAGLDDFDGSVKLVNRKLSGQLLPGARVKMYSGSVHHGFQYPGGDWKGVWCMKRAQDCEDPFQLFQSMDPSEQKIWNPVIDSIRDEIPVTL